MGSGELPGAQFYIVSHSEWLCDSQEYDSYMEDNTDVRNDDPANRSTALMTDRYELTMLEAALEDGTAHRRSVFEAFARNTPAGAPWGVMVGNQRITQAVRDFRFEEDQLSYLRSFLKDSTIDYLRNFQFNGSISAFLEGELWAGGCPLVTVEGTFGECVVLETVILSVLNSSIAVATAAAQIRLVVGNKLLVEMGSRRIHERAAVDMARAAYIGGFDVSSNLQAGYEFGIPTAGTVAHAWVMAHTDEFEAMGSQMRSLGTATTVLVDTYNIAGGIDLAVKAARSLGAVGPGAVRIDSGDLGVEANLARAQLDRLGATHTMVLLSGDLDLKTITELENSKVEADAYGVGTRLAAAPPPGIVYKLVEIETDGVMRPVVKLSASPGKSCYGGKRCVWRKYDGEKIAGDIVEYDGVCVPGATKLLQQKVYEARRIVLSEDLETARNRLANSLAALANPHDPLGVAYGAKLAGTLGTHRRVEATAGATRELDVDGSAGDMGGVGGW